jgi:D-ribose pyranose/furanose isomerase RbsD
MKFNFLTYENMANNLLKSVVATAVIATGVSAETPNLNSATSVAVRESGIDFKSQIAQIDIKITQTQTKIDLILQKGNLSEEDQLKYLTLEENIEKLTAEKDIIRDNQNRHKREKVTMVNNSINTKKENLNKETKTGNELDKQLSIADHKLAALESVSRLLNK